MSDFVTRADIKNTLLTSLKSVLAKREADIKLMQDKEAKGRAKLEKTDFSYKKVVPYRQPGEKTSSDKAKADAVTASAVQKEAKKVKKNELCNDNGVLPNLDKQDIPEVAPTASSVGAPMAMAEGKNICIGCTSHNVEPLGLHQGHDHFICKDCGEVGATIREENQAAEMVKEELDKVAPPDEERLVHKLKDQYGHDEEGKKKVYATAWAIHNKAIRNKGKKDDKDVEKREIASVESARQAVGVAGSGPKLPSVNKPKGPAAPAIKDAFNTGGKPNPMGKAEKTPFNDGAGTTGKPHEVIPGSDVAVDAAKKDTVPPAAGKVIEAKGSGGDVMKTKLSKEELEKGSFAAVDQKATALANKPAAQPTAQPAAQPTAQPTAQPAGDSSGIIPTAREKANVKKGVTSLATVRQRWHGAGKMDANDIVSRLKPVLQNLPNLHASIDKLASVLGGVPKQTPSQKVGQISTVGRDQYRVGTNPATPGSFKSVDQKAQAMGKAEGIPAAPKPPGAKAATGVAAKAPPVAGATSTTKTPSRL